MYGLLVTLCFSRYAFLAISLRQDAAAVIDGLESACVFFGGVVKRLVEDNLKPVVTRPASPPKLDWWFPPAAGRPPHCTVSGTLPRSL